MAQNEINLALHQAKILFVRQTQQYMLAVAAIDMLCIFALSWINFPETKVPVFSSEFSILYVTIVLLLLSYVVFRIGSRITVNFALIASTLLVMVLPFSFLALFPLNQFQQDREYIDYKRRLALLPNLKHANVRNLSLKGRIPILAWVGIVLGPVFILGGLLKVENNLPVILGVIVFSAGLYMFNRTNITIRGERIIIRRSGLGGGLRRSNFTVIHRIEVTNVEQRGGRLWIKYAFVGTGYERVVLFIGSVKACDYISNALTAQSEDNLYDLNSMVLEPAPGKKGRIEPHMPQMTDTEKGSQGADLVVTSQDAPQSGKPAVASIGVRTLIAAIRSNQLGLVNQLLEVGVDVNAVDPTGKTPLQIAQLAGNDQIIKLLTHAGAQV